jgi:hypothetical protein
LLVQHLWSFPAFFWAFLLKPWNPLRWQLRPLHRIWIIWELLGQSFTLVLATLVGNKEINSCFCLCGHRLSIADSFDGSYWKKRYILPHTIYSFFYCFKFKTGCFLDKVSLSACVFLGPIGS